mmetsp:Transcript_159/g.340  ORF Transcript_159/g.340 Transcript_159/m.340 type:complete len:282 (-) Transcript_159:78-923(-)
MSLPQQQQFMSVLFFLAAVISTTTSFTSNKKVLPIRRNSIRSSSVERLRWQQQSLENKNRIIRTTPKTMSSYTILFTATASTTTNLQYDDYSNNNNNEAEEEISNPLKSAGLSFISASTKSLGMLFYNIGGMDHKEIQALLLEAGTHLVNAGTAWTSDWDIVRDCMYSASQSFYSISNVFGSANIDESLELGTLFEQIGNELEDISNIGGCTSVGPPCSSPNLLAVEEYLVAISKILKKNSVAATDEHMMCTLFYEVAGLFGEMASRYVEDEEGQKSEVSL